MCDNVGGNPSDKTTRESRPSSPSVGDNGQNPWTNFKEVVNKLGFPPGNRHGKITLFGDTVESGMTSCMRLYIACILLHLFLGIIHP